jgi:hypothetical protein
MKYTLFHFFKKEMDNTEKIEQIEEQATQVKSLVNDVKIKYDNKSYSQEEFKVKIDEWTKSLTDDTNENYVQFNKFVEKLDEGALIWHYGEDYGSDFTGYHSNERKKNYVLYSEIANPKMIFHGQIARGKAKSDCHRGWKEQDYLCQDGTCGYLDKDCDFTFYYVPKTELKFISDLHNVISHYTRYEDVVKTLPKKLQEIVYSPNIEMIDSDIIIYITDYFWKNMESYKLVKLN